MDAYICPFCLNPVAGPNSLCCGEAQAEADDILDFESPVPADEPVQLVAEGPEDLNDFDGYW